VGETEPVGQNARHGRLPGPLPAADPERIPQGRKSIPLHAESVIAPAAEFKSCSSRPELIIYP
jgi:hypothetical protein